jgi:hypothetical protein
VTILAIRLKFNNLACLRTAKEAETLRLQEKHIVELSRNQELALEVTCILLDEILAQSLWRDHKSYILGHRLDFGL